MKAERIRRSSYTVEYKLEAVRLVQGGQSCAVMAKVLGMPSQTIRELGSASGKRLIGECSKHSLPIAPNLLNRNFQPAAPNRVWTSDITYIQTVVSGGGP